MQNLTPKRLKVLNAFKDWKEPYPPTVDEIADILGVSRVTAFSHIRRLVKDGYLIETESKIRKYVLKGNQDESS